MRPCLSQVVNSISSVSQFHESRIAPRENQWTLNQIAYIFLILCGWGFYPFVKVPPCLLSYYHFCSMLSPSRCGMTNSTCADHPGSSWDSHPTRFGWRGSCQGADQVQCGTSEVAQPRHLGSNEVVARCGEVVGVLNGIQWLFSSNFLFWRVLMIYGKWMMGIVCLMIWERKIEDRGEMNALSKKKCRYEEVSHQPSVDSSLSKGDPRNPQMMHKPTTPSLRSHSVESWTWETSDIGWSLI